MSQVYFETTKNGRRLEIMGGWDVPLQHYHLMVADLDAPITENDLVFASLDDPTTSGCKKVGPFVQVLMRLGIDAPPGFWDRFRRQEGNVVHRYHGKGEWSRS